MKTIEGGDLHHLSLRWAPPAQPHFRAAPALFGAATGCHPQPWLVRNPSGGLPGSP